MASTLPRVHSDDAPWKTHTVFNQAPPLVGVDVFASNTPLVEAVEREGAGWVTERASELGRFVGGEPQLEWGRLANENEPVLRTFDRYGNRIDEVEFHPAWHELMRMGVANELHSLPWTSDRPSPHTARAAPTSRGGGRTRPADLSRSADGCVRPPHPATATIGPPSRRELRVDLPHRPPLPHRPRPTRRPRPIGRVGRGLR